MRLPWNPAPTGSWSKLAPPPGRETTSEAPEHYRFDPAGRPGIAYGGHQLYYASWDGSRWQLETVDGDGDVGRATSLGLDAAGNPGLSYVVPFSVRSAASTR